MYRFLLFLKSIQVVLLFIILELVAGWFFFGSNPYQKAKLINSSNVVMSSLYDVQTTVKNYFGLSSENERLAAENAKLRRELSLYKSQNAALSDTIPAIDPKFLGQKFTAARVIRNNFTKQNNYITIDKGSADGIKPEMALINQDGIVGYVLDCSDNVSVAISVLHHNDFRTIAKDKHGNYTGLVMWDGDSYRVAQLDEIPKYANIQVGDTIVTNEYSNIFPADYLIGTIRDFELVGKFYKANIDLFVDMSKITHVYAIEIPLQAERSELEKQNIPEQSR